MAIGLVFFFELAYNAMGRRMKGLFRYDLFPAAPSDGQPDSFFHISRIVETD